MILVVNGPNLNLLGERKPEVYGSEGLDRVEQNLREIAATEDQDLKFFQSNHEGEIIDFLHENRKAASGVLINPGALTHYSYSLRDALEAIDLPAIEIHISDIKNREDFRAKSVIEPVAVAQVAGRGLEGYEIGFKKLMEQVGGQ